MTNPTSNFGWQMPTPTDLVTDLPADFEVFGQAVDTTLADLKGGTSGQVLAKASATDMDFTWTTPEIGDITAITVTAPITGGGTSGSVGIAVSAASTAASGVVQLSDSTSTTSSVLAATPTAVKSAYDLANTANTTANSATTTANAAIPKSTVTTAGDVIYATGSSAVTRLGIGTANQVLRVNSGATAPEWATVGASGMTLVKRASFSAVASTTTTFDGVFTSTYDNYLIVADKVYGSVVNANLQFQWRVGSTTQSGASFYGAYFGYSYSGTLTTNSVNAATSFPISQVGNSTTETTAFNITASKVVSSDTPQIYGTAYEANRAVPLGLGAKYNTAIAASGFILSLSSGNITGTVSVYGLAKA